MAERTSKPLTRGDLVLAFVLVLAVVLLWAVRAVVVLVAFSVLMAYLLDPIADRLERLPLPRGRRISRGLASGFVIVMLMALLGLAAAWGAPLVAQQVVSFVAGLPAQLQTLSEDLRSRASTSRLGIQLDPVIDSLSARARTLLPEIANWLLRSATDLFARIEQMFGLLLLPVFTFYFMADGERVRDSLLAFTPGPVQESVANSRGRVHRALQSYVRGQVLVCLMMATGTGLVLVSAQMPNALLLALLAGLAEIVPVLGAIIAALAIFLSGLTVDLPRALIGVSLYYVMNWLLGVFVTPRVMARELKLHPFVIMVSVLVGAQLLGPAGAILALPAAAIFQAVVEDAAARRKAPAGVARAMKD